MMTKSRTDFSSRIAGSPMIRTAYGIFASSLAGTALNAVAIFVAARVYSPADVGAGSAAIALGGFIATAGSLGLGTGLMRFLPRAGLDATRLVRSSYAAAVGLSAFITSCVAFSPLGANVIDPTLQHAAGHILLVVGAAASGAALVQDGVLVSARRSGLLLVRTMASGVIRLVAVLTLTSAGVVGYLASWSVAIAIPSIWVMRSGAMTPARTIATERVSRRAVIAFSSRTYVLDMIEKLPLLVLPITVVTVSGPAENAYFAVPLFASTLLYAVARSANASLLAEISRPDTDYGAALRHALRFVFWQLVPLIIAVWLVGTATLGLIGPDYSERGSWPIRLLALSALPNAIASPYFAIRKAHGRLRGLFFIGAVGTAVTLLLGLALISRFGATGAAAAILAGQFVVMVIVLGAVFAARRRRH